MPSSYTTSLRLTLPATGENSGTWGTLVNTGITELTDAAIAGYVSIAMTDADYTLTVANGLTDQARRMMLNMTGTLTAARNVICPTASKLYIIKNATTGGFAITLKTSAGTGISIPNGSSMLLMCNGTDVVNAVTNFSSLTLGSPLLPASGGTGITSLGTGVATWLGTPSSANLAAAVTDETGSGALVFGTSPTLASPTITGTGTAAFGNLSYTGTLTGGTGVVNLGSGQFYKDASGNVGIGLTTPSTVLEVRPAAETALAAENAGILIRAISGSVNRYSFLNFGGSGFAGSVSQVASQTTTIGTDYLSSAGALVLTTKSAASATPTERMRIDSAGNVGIGTASPATRLHVSSTGATTARIESTTTGTPGVGVELLGATTAKNWKIGSNLITVGGLDFIPSTAVGGATFTTAAMTLDASGNLGIGTASPGVPLDVNGEARIRSNFYVYGAGDRLNVFPQAAGSGANIVATNNANSAYAPLVLDGSRAVFNVAGTEGMRLTSTGLGIGTNAPKAAFETSATSDAPSLTAASGVAALTTDSSVRLIFGGYTTAPYGFWLQTKDNQTVGGNGSGTSYPLLLNPIGGNVGIGTASPTRPLTIGTAVSAYMIANGQTTGASYQSVSTTGANVSWGSADSAGGLYTNATAYAGFFGTFNSTALQLVTNGAARATLDSSGNLGLGVTPSAWSGFKAIQVGNGSFGDTVGGSNNALFGSNTYFNGAAFTYINTTTATLYRQLSGQHIFYNAPSGTAGNTISFTQAMTLDASGNLLVNRTAVVGSEKLSVNGGARFETFADLIGGAGTPELRLYQNTNNWSVRNSAGALAFYDLTGSAERARITSGGDLLVGTTAGGGVGISLYNQANNGNVARIDLNKSASGASTAMSFRHNGTAVGSIVYSNTDTTYVTTSDYRLKGDQQPLTGSGAFIDALNPKTWTWKTEGTRGVGFIAHEAQAVSPSSVVGEKDAVDEDGNPVMQAMEYGSAEFIANIIAELKSLRARVASLETQP